MARALGLEPGSRVILRLEEGRIVLLPLELGLKTPDAVLAGTAPAAGCGAVVGNDGLCAQRPTEAAYLYLSAHVPAQATDDSASPPASGVLSCGRPTAPTERTIALPFPEALAGVLEEIREMAGWLWARGWAERNAGNVSVDVTEALAGPPAPEGRFVPADIPDAGLAWRSLVVSATGARFRDVARAPGNGLLLIRVRGDGYEVLSAGADVRAGVTSELVSHLRIHARLASTGSGHRAVLHTHPTSLIALNHMPDGGDARFLTRALWSVMPEVSVFVADGVGVAPYCLPGGWALADATIDALARHRVVVWDKHGCVAVERDVVEAFDLIDTLDKAAAIYLRCLAAGAPPRGLTDDEIAALHALAREMGRTR